MLLLELAPLRHERVFRYARVAHCPVSGACVLPVWLAAKGKREPGALAYMRCNNDSCICQQGPDCPRNGEQVRVHHALHGKSVALGWAGSHCFVWALRPRPHRYGDTKWEGDASKLASPDTGLKRVCWRQEGCSQQNLVVCGEAGKLCQ